MDLAAISNDIEKIVVSEEQIQNRLKEMAAQVLKDYEGRDLILVGVLKVPSWRWQIFLVICNVILIWIGWQFLLTVPEQNQVVLSEY